MTAFLPFHTVLLPGFHLSHPSPVVSRSTLIYMGRRCLELQMPKLGGRTSHYLVSNVFTTKNSLELSGLSFPKMSGFEKKKKN